MHAEVGIIGAGAVGLACAAELASAGKRVLAIERHAAAGRETSSRNSQVIHAGLYYPSDSLKARTCVEGRTLLYEHCAKHGVAHRRTGKFVVAGDAREAAQLESLRARALANGAGAVELVDAARLRHEEPRLRAHAALWSPESGIVDAQALVSSYQAELEARGGSIAFRTEVIALEELAGAGWRVVTRGPDREHFSVEVGWLVNAAGLAADAVAALAGIDLDAANLRHQPCKGDYFAVAPGLGALTRALVYPLPQRGGLGIHLTLDLGGRYRLGPDVEWTSETSLEVRPEKAAEFAAAARRYLPELEAAHLTPDFAGIRAKLQGPGEEFRDFHIAEASALGAPRLVNLLGLESPGLTAAGAIARRVRAIICSE
jgi:L-2-hydroxyglutarate oxidase LhgO